MDTVTNVTTNEPALEEIDIPESPPIAQKPASRGGRFRFPALEWMIVAALAIAALIPRIILATQLDLVTDEHIYIQGAKIYLPLLLHFQFNSSGWLFNYEHPPLVKLLIGLSIDINAHLGHIISSELIAARIPSIIFGTLLVVAIYWLGRAPFGRVVALLAALCLAFSPWLAYFSALAYLDITMTTLITIAYLLLWPAIRRPRLYLLVAALVGLGVASKYTAALAIPGIMLFTAYYFFVMRFRLPRAERPRIPWLWWIASLALAPVAFFIVDPAIWRSPFNLLKHSFKFEWHHSVEGHLTFLAGQYSGHVPHWAILYIIFNKMSVFVTIPAAFFVLYALVQLVRFHLLKSQMTVLEATGIAFLLIWLLSILGMFSLLNIVVGTHYHLPLAPPVALAGAAGLAVLLRYRRSALFASRTAPKEAQTAPATAGPVPAVKRSIARINPRAAIVLAVMAVLLVIPHFVGLTTTYAAEGYTSEVFHGEDSTLQVAYAAYKEAGIWLLAHTHGSGKVGMAAIVGTLLTGYRNVGWAPYNPELKGRLKFIEVHPTDTSFPDDYLIWPMHLVQRGYAIPPFWRSRVVHIIMGGNTIYCYILARNPATITP